MQYFLDFVKRFLILYLLFCNYISFSHLNDTIAIFRAAAARRVAIASSQVVIKYYM